MKLSFNNTVLLCLCFAMLTGCKSKDGYKKSPENEKTVFQTAREWRPTIDNRADVAIIYGVDGNPSDKARRVPFEERVKSWKDRGYKTHFMTGIAWGEYQDYFTGKWDGEWHLDEGQVRQNGDTVWHGRLVPYIVPSKNFLTYLKEKHIKRVIDAGIDAIYLEEPEFWAFSGYSDAFKREWENYYGFPWRPQHESPENTWLSNKLKYELYYRALEDVFTYAKEYGKSKGMNIRCYVPTHSLVNYSQWQIVSPEASLASMPCVDGYIAQIWTGTSREPNYYNNIYKERVFETAFLEYGSMESMTAPTGRKMFFLTDPIEDRAKDWEDYQKNYQATFVAQLLYPGINDYEVMPWPERIYEGLYRTSADSDKRERIPRYYSTQMHIMINILNDMQLSDNRVSGSQGISVLMGNSLMFQRFPTHEGYEDPQLSNFYGLALPFIKRGVPVNTVHIENLAYPTTLQNTKVLLMTYSNMKPLSPEAHDQLAAWVKKGGVLVYCCRDNDPFQLVSEWWNQNGMDYPTASAHLFEKLGMDIAQPIEAGKYPVKKGMVYILRKDPKEFVLQDKGDADFVNTVKELYEKDARAGQLEFKNNFSLSRGPYLLTAVLDESVTNTPITLNGTFIDLFDSNLPVLSHKTVSPGEQSMLYNIESVKDKQKPQVLAAACRVSDEMISGKTYSFICKGPVETTNNMRILLPQLPERISVLSAIDKMPVNLSYDWDTASKTLLLSFDNQPDGIEVYLDYSGDYIPYTQSDADTAFNAFFQAFYDKDFGVCYENITRKKRAAIWVQAIYWDMIMNAYKRTGNNNHLALMEEFFQGAGRQYSNYDWSDTKEWFIYDDIMWWVISFARAYEITKDDKYLSLSQSGFDRIWNGLPGVDNGSYDPVNGGMFWGWKPTERGKTACINYPTVIAAMTLFNITGQKEYYDKAKDIYKWSRKALFDSKTGKIGDHQVPGNPTNWTTNLYNQGTAIGAAMMLYNETKEQSYLDDAILIADYTRYHMSDKGGMILYKNGIEQGIYTAIFGQYIIRLIEDGNQQQYLPWLRYNINTAWNNRNKERNLTYKDIRKSFSPQKLESYDASGCPALMQLIDPDTPF